MIQIFGTNKSFDCKAAQRFFKERRIDFQFIDLKEKEMSRGEFDSVVTALARTEGGRDAALEVLTDKSSKDYSSFAYLDDSEKEDKLFENQAKLLKQPVCRNKNGGKMRLMMWRIENNCCELFRQFYKNMSLVVTNCKLRKQGYNVPGTLACNRCLVYHLNKKYPSVIIPPTNIKIKLIIETILFKIIQPIAFAVESDI